MGKHSLNVTNRKLLSFIDESWFVAQTYAHNGRTPRQEQQLEIILSVHVWIIVELSFKLDCIRDICEESRRGRQRNNTRESSSQVNTHVGGTDRCSIWFEQAVTYIAA